LRFCSARPPRTGDDDEQHARQFKKLAEVQQNLLFAQITKGEPILKLSAPENGEEKKPQGGSGPHP
jgi:hypothetical protein